MNLKQIFKKIITLIITLEAIIILKKYSPIVIAVTGNVGKTTTKDAIYAVLSRELFIRKSEKSFNSEIGIPLTILGCDNAWDNPWLWLKNITTGLELIFFKDEYPKYLVLEVGADHPGDIRSVSKWLNPDIVVVTRIPDVPVHIEFFSSRGELLEEKSYLVGAMKKTGTLILNADDADVLRMREKNKNVKVMTYGIDNTANVRAVKTGILYHTESKMKVLSGMEFDVEIKGVVKNVKVEGAVGAQHIYPVLAALSVAESIGVSADRALLALKSYKPPHGRMNVLKGKNKTTIIDDTYNSSPEALKEALVVLKNAHISGRKIAVLGDMLELGKYSTEAHYEIGKLVNNSADILVVVGMRARGFVEGARTAGMKSHKIFSFENSVKAGNFLDSFLLKKDLILFKGSQGVRIEKAILPILEDPKRAGDLLVRQEEEWKNR
ncbi:MAG: UDP-N-acetylmuramoyl-tripeptide--D-alanyl-D-alanine ligase [bacterium]|nr:UDP-N-acetylmuramoyl-tripeptide--D-alanyl-D-alanine ligase [bacterium]